MLKNEEFKSVISTNIICEEKRNIKRDEVEKQNQIYRNKERDRFFRELDFLIETYKKKGFELIFEDGNIKLKESSDKCYANIPKKYLKCLKQINDEFSYKIFENGNIIFKNNNECDVINIHHWINKVADTYINHYNRNEDLTMLSEYRPNIVEIMYNCRIISIFKYLRF